MTLLRYNDITTSDTAAPVTIVGGGTMGRNIALHLLLHGEAVRLCEIDAVSRAAVRPLLQAAVDLILCHGLPHPPAGWERHLTLHAELAEAVTGADLVIEAIPEDREAKQALLRELETHCGADVIFASNTSGFLPSSLAKVLAHPERLLVAHFWNPAHLVPLVELVPHNGTGADVVKTMWHRLRSWDKQVVVLRGQVEGFIGNRLAFAMHREAMDLVDRGIATPDEIDTVVKYGFGRRLAASGVFGAADLGGLDVYLAVCASLFPDLCASRGVPQKLAELVEQRRLGVKTGAGWRQYDEHSAATLQNAVADELLRYARMDMAAKPTRLSSDDRSGVRLAENGSAIGPENAATTPGHS